MLRSIKSMSVRVHLFSVALLVTLLALPASALPQSAQAPAGPIPAQISSAKRVFISNGGGECSPFGQTAFSGRPDRPYDQFYAAMKSWARYELVDTPADADLVLEIQFSCPLYFDEKITHADPRFRLLILDPKTRILLWAFTEHVPTAILQGNRDKNFDQSMTNLVASIQRLPTSPNSAANTAKK
jgi:hypothetical protein